MASWDHAEKGSDLSSATDFPIQFADLQSSKLGQELFLQQAKADTKVDEMFGKVEFINTDAQTVFAPDFKVVITDARSTDLERQQPAKSELKTFAPEIQRDEQGRITSIRSGNGVMSEYMYDVAGNLECFRIGENSWVKKFDGMWEAEENGIAGRTRRDVWCTVVLEKNGVLQIDMGEAKATMRPDGSTTLVFADGSRKDGRPEGGWVARNSSGRVYQTMYPGGDRYDLVQKGSGSEIFHYVPQAPGSPAYYMSDKFKGTIDLDGKVVVDDDASRRRLEFDGTTSVSMWKSEGRPTQIFYENGIKAIVTPGFRGPVPHLYREVSPNTWAADSRAHNVKMDRNFNIQYSDENGQLRTIKPTYRK